MQYVGGMVEKRQRFGYLKSALRMPPVDWLPVAVTPYEGVFVKAGECRGTFLYSEGVIGERPD